MLFLNVPYSQKDEAKQLGALWNPIEKKWYVKNKKDYPKFMKWMTEETSFNIICDHIYIIEGLHQCFRCHKETRVIGFGIENFYECDQADEKSCEYQSGIIRIASYFPELPKDILTYIQSHYNYKQTYSKFAETRYMANRCDHCGVLQGDFFIFNEVESPFWIGDEKAAARLKLFKVPLKSDIIVDYLPMGWGSNDELIKAYGKIIDLELNEKSYF